jgi:hypothetical protein
MSYFKDWLPQELKLIIISYIEPNKINFRESDFCITTIENLPEKTSVFPAKKIGTIFCPKGPPWGLSRRPCGKNIR